MTAETLIRESTLKTREKRKPSVSTDDAQIFFNYSFFLERGITHRALCVATPAQNNRVERKHRQLMLIARSLRFQSGLSIKLSGECILTATHIYK